MGHHNIPSSGMEAQPREIKNYITEYRVYFCKDGDLIILLLCGGTKNTQEEDIEKAKEYWRDYERSQNPKK